jgi:hypothetical protein
MKCKMVIPVALLFLAVLRPAVAIAVLQDEADKSKKNDAPKTDEKKNSSTVSVKIRISAEGRTALPSEARIEWQGIEETCKNVTGGKRLDSNETSVNFPTNLCKVKLTVFMTGYDTAAVTVDLATNKEKCQDLIRITVKRQGPPEVDCGPST